MNPDQTAPLGSSLIWARIACNKGCQITSADKQADSNFSDQWKRFKVFRQLLETRCLYIFGKKSSNCNG